LGDGIYKYFKVIYYVSNKWQKVSKVFTNHLIHQNTKEIQTILFVEVVGKENFAIGAITIQV
jgi:hypothetical protein